MIDDEHLQHLCTESLDERLSDRATLRMRRAFAEALQSGTPESRAPREILTMDEVAEFLRTTPDEVDRSLAGVPCFELGGKILFRRDAVLAWVARRERAFGVDLLASDLREDDVPALVL